MYFTPCWLGLSVLFASVLTVNAQASDALEKAEQSYTSKLEKARIKLEKAKADHQKASEEIAVLQQKATYQEMRSVDPENFVRDDARRRARSRRDNANIKKEAEKADKKLRSAQKSYMKSVKSARRSLTSALKRASREAADEGRQPDADKWIAEAKELEEAPISLLGEPNTCRLQVELCVDGDTELHITKDGLFLTNGQLTKLGGSPTIEPPAWVDYKPWRPVWNKPEKQSGVDRTALYPIQLPTLNLTHRLLAVDEIRKGKGIAPRTPLAERHEKDSYILTIGDKEQGAMWYRIEFVSKKK